MAIERLSKKLAVYLLISFHTLYFLFVGSVTAKRHNESNHDLLVTTAFWNVESKLGNRTNGLHHYSSRFRTFMNLTANLAIYGDPGSLAHVFIVRKHHHSPDSLIRLIVESNYFDFDPCQTHLAMLTNAPGNYSDPINVPNIDLGCIWLSKLWLLQNSAQELPAYNWHLWLDIGLHLQTDKSINPSRFPNLEKLQNLPKDKVIVSGSGCNNDLRPCQYGESSDYYLGRFVNQHCIAGTSFLIHRDGIPLVLPEFQKAFERCLQFYSSGAFRSQNIKHNAFPCMSDQIIMSHMDPKFVHSIGVIGYGAVAYDLLC